MNRGGREGVIFAGGGTAGHVYPGLEVAERLVAGGIGHGDIAFMGSDAGSGAGVVRESGFEFVPVNLRGISRSNALRNVALLWELPWAIVRSLEEVKSRSPKIVVGLGGYSSIPVLVAAALMGVRRTILQEDATLGVSNRIASWMCKKIGVAFPAPAEIFGRKGIRIRPAIRESISRLASSRDPARAKTELGVSSGRRAVVFVGGSLGAGPINKAARLAAARWRERDDMAVIHVCGERFIEECRTEAARLDLEHARIQYELVGFEPRFDVLLEASDVAVTRGGATTVGELGASGTAAVVVPSSYVTANHQEPNARALEAAGGCEVVLDSEISTIPDLLDALLEDEGRLDAMRAAGPSVCEAALAFYDVVVQVGGLNA